MKMLGTGGVQGMEKQLPCRTRCGVERSTAARRLEKHYVFLEVLRIVAVNCLSRSPGRGVQWFQYKYGSEIISRSMWPWSINSFITRSE